MKSGKKQSIRLIVSATEMEIAPFREKAEEKGWPVEFCVTGAGIPATVFHLTRTLTGSGYRQVINAGIAGSFVKSLRPGSVVEVEYDCFGDLGAEDGTGFLHISEIGLAGTEMLFSAPYFPVSFVNFSQTGLQKVKAVTVNKVHGNNESISAIRKKFNPEIETMEGAAVAFVCHLMQVECIQIRSISNYIERRDKSKWNIPLAIKELNKALERLF